MSTARPASEPEHARNVTGSTPLLDRAVEGARERFRLHTSDHEAPANRRLFTMTLWAALCVFVGLIPAVRLVAALAFADTPAWYPLASVTAGVLGIAMITAAFAAIHRDHLPWLLLSAATVFLAANITLIYTVL